MRRMRAIKAFRFSSFRESSEHGWEPLFFWIWDLGLHDKKLESHLNNNEKDIHFSQNFRIKPNQKCL
jgi:hypothetical protein